MRIAIVNNAPPAIETLRRVLKSAPEHQVAWVARDGADAVEKCARDKPDVILMDLNLPVMDGSTATRLIMEKTPCAILLVTSTVTGSTSKVFEAMGAGALDVVNTPVMSPRAGEGCGELLAKIAMLGKLIGKKTLGPGSQSGKTPAPPSAPSLPPLVVFGCSTGGPKALAEIVSVLPASFPAAIVVVQHIDVQFAPGLAAWLRELTPLSVEVAEVGGTPKPGVVTIAATNDHLVLRAGRTFTYTAEPAELPYRPSVDVFFKSVAKHWPGRGTAVLLTGMGNDGAQGLLALQREQWHTIAQDQATSVVYAMPRAAIQLNAAREVLPVTKMAAALIARVEQQKAPKPRPT